MPRLWLILGAAGLFISGSLIGAVVGAQVARQEFADLQVQAVPAPHRPGTLPGFQRRGPSQHALNVFQSDPVAEPQPQPPAETAPSESGAAPPQPEPEREVAAAKAEPEPAKPEAVAPAPEPKASRSPEPKEAPAEAEVALLFVAAVIATDHPDVETGERNFQIEEG